MSVFGQPGGLFGNNNATANTNAPGTTPGAGTSSNIFGSGSTFGAPKPGGGGSLFGAPTGGGAATGGSLFGLSAPQSAFGAPKPAEPSAAAPATSSAGFFSQPPASTSGATPSLFGLSKPPGDSATAPPTSLFGSAPAAPTASAEPPKSNLFGGSNLFSKPAETSAPTPAASADASAPKPSLFGGGSLFGAKPAATTTASTSSSTTPAPAPASAANSFLKPGSLFGAAPASTSSGTTTAAPAAPTTSLFGAPKPAEKKDGAAAPAPTTSLFGAPASKPEEKKDGAATANASAFSLGAKPAEATTSSLAPTTVAVQPPSMLRGKSVEEIVNKWSSDLETHVRDFNKFAGEVAVWDRALIENGNNLSAILSHVVAAEREQNEVNQALDSIEQQQRDLIATLDNYEKVAQELAGGSGSVRVTDKGPADMERDKNYMLATDLQVHLDDLSGSLTQMIESVNSLTLPSENSSGQDPMAQISGILSSHLESLQWIDGAVREVESKVTEVERKVKETGHGSTLNASRPRGFGLR